MSAREVAERERTSIAFPIPQAVQILMQLQLNLHLFQRHLLLAPRLLSRRRRRLRSANRLDDRQRDRHEVHGSLHEAQARWSSSRSFRGFVLRFGGVEEEDLDGGQVTRLEGTEGDALLRLRR